MVLQFYSIRVSRYFYWFFSLSSPSHESLYVDVDSRGYGVGSPSTKYVFMALCPDQITSSEYFFDRLIDRVKFGGVSQSSIGYMLVLTGSVCTL